MAGCGQVITRVTPTATATATIGLTQVATIRPTATPAPYTPAPTATPTLTPTPIIYVIQRGDSLLKIARQFGVSVQGLQEVNGITDPRTLQINQELVIPREELAAAGTPTPTPTPLPFAVENVSFSQTPLGGLWCFGEVHNTTPVDLEQAAVTISLLDKDGQVLAQTQEYAQIDLIAPGGRAPFAVRFLEPPASFDSYLAEPWLGVRGTSAATTAIWRCAMRREKGSATPRTRCAAPSPTPARKTPSGCPSPSRSTIPWAG